MSWIEAARRIVRDKTACRVDVQTGHLVPDGRRRRGKVVLLDLFSASVMVQVHDALNPENQAKFDGLHVVTAQRWAFKLSK